MQGCVFLRGCVFFSSKSTAISHRGVTGPSVLRRVDLIRTGSAREPAQIPLLGTVGRSARVGPLNDVTA